MVVVADQSIRERKRPILVWVISIYYIYAFIWGLWASIPVIRAEVPVSTNPDSGKFILTINFLTTGLWFVASIFLIFFRKAAVSLFVAGFLIGLGYTLLTIPDWRRFLALPLAWLTGILIGELVKLSICVYAWYLKRTGVLT